MIILHDQLPVETSGEKFQRHRAILRSMIDCSWVSCDLSLKLQSNLQAHTLDVSALFGVWV